MSGPLLPTSGPFFTYSLFLTALALGFAFYGWKVSLAGRPLMRDELMK